MQPRRETAFFCLESVLNRQRKHLSPLRSWIRFLLRTHVKRVSQRSVESRGFSPGALVSSHRES
jgi:hypothetical protein